MGKRANDVANLTVIGAVSHVEDRPGDGGERQVRGIEVKDVTAGLPPSY
jgi:hypothetical protein